MLRRRTKAATCAGLILLLAACLGLLATRPPSPLAAAEYLFQAAAFHLLGPRATGNARVVVIGIDEDTLSAFPYRSPIDRGFLADLVNRLAAAGVAAIGLDVVFDRPTEPAKDLALQRALHRTDVPVVAISLGPEARLPRDRQRFLGAFLQGVRTGDANLLRDRFDDVVRLHRPVQPETGQLSFPAALAASLGVAVPAEPFLIAWRRGPASSQYQSLPVYPAQTVPLLPVAWLRGKVAVIGSLIPGEDEHRTIAGSFGKPTFGVQIHAQVLSQLLAGRIRPVRTLPWWELATVGSTAAIGLAAGLTLAGIMAAVAMTLAALGFLAAVLAAYATSGILLPAVGPLTALIIACGTARVWRGLGERRDRHALRTLFSRFVSEAVVRELMSARDTFLAGGRPRPQELTATVLFADVASFTTICEGMAPAPLVTWIDRYIDTMADIIAAHDGVLLRFIGDGILAVFGVPVPHREEAEIARDARNAARCAQAMERAMQRLNDDWDAAGLPVAGLRVGLHTGPLVAGSLGTGARMEYCLLGDTANTASRLEQLGKDYAEPGPRASTIVIGEATWKRLGPGFEGTRIGEVTLRGKQEVLAAYRIDTAAVHSRQSAPAESADTAACDLRPVSS